MPPDKCAGACHCILKFFAAWVGGDGVPAACRVHQDGRAGDGTERQHHMQCHLSRICADRSDTQPARRHSKGQGHFKGLHPLSDTFSHTKRERVDYVPRT